MKINTILLFFVVAGFSLSAQNKSTKVADKLVERYEYVQAVQEYLPLVETGKSDGYVQKQLGDCYYNMHNTVAAEKWYSQAVKTNQAAETYYRYAQVLKSNGKYAEANVQMKAFATMVPNDQRTKEFIANPDYLTELINKEKLFEVNKISLNSNRSDFGAVLYGEVLYFASARNESNKTYGWNDEPFLDIYQSAYNENKKYSEPIPVTELNSTFHEGPLTMTKDGNTIYFSSESLKDKLFEKDSAKKLKFGQVNLYKANKENGKWGVITPLPFNSKSFSTGNPSIDKESKTLYFASNMPGSKGGTDIWKVAVNADGTFGTPENMGDTINTFGDENFPYITEDNILYFSSNGLAGFGGLDVFSVDLNQNGAPNNIGKPVNTEKDDFAFTFNKEKNIGYLSSNRAGGDDIYSIAPVCKGQVLTVVQNAKTEALIPNSKVVILDENGAILDTQYSNEKGEVLYDLECQKAYAIEVYKDGFVTGKFSIAKLTGGKVLINAVVAPIEVIVTETEIVLKPIYFENDKSTITKWGAAELDKLVYIMSQNKNLIIYAKSHTDFRGTNQYNLKLSDRRAKSTVQYIISKGIDASRISGKGFGESDPKVNCKKCSEEEHTLNRRSEFMIVK